MIEPENMKDVESLEEAKTLDYWEVQNLSEEEAQVFWDSLSPEETVRFANYFKPEWIEPIPAEYQESVRAMRANSLELALNELEAVQAEDGKFIFDGECDEDDEAFELNADYCRKRLAELAPKLVNGTEETLTFYGYHNIRLWVEAYNLLLKEMGETV